MRGWRSARPTSRRSSPCSTTPPSACSTRSSGRRRRPTPSWSPDRAGWAFYTPKAGGRIDRSHPTQLGRALSRLGIEHIGAYSPQARGRGERINRTLQDRLVNELRVAGITTVAAANEYLRQHFIPDYNACFSGPPADPRPAFVALGDADLDQLLCEEEARVVGQDNVVTFDGVALQLAKQPDRPTCARLHVTVRRHLDGTHTVWRGPVCLGRFDSAGHLLARASQPRRRDHRRPTETIPVVVPRLRQRPRPTASPNPPARPRSRPRLPVAANV
jgi:hypothetical protein